jgi:hypothetical protein
MAYQYIIFAISPNAKKPSIRLVKYKFHRKIEKNEKFEFEINFNLSLNYLLIAVVKKEYSPEMNSVLA